MKNEHIKGLFLVVSIVLLTSMGCGMCARDTTPPDTKITSSPPASSSRTLAIFKFTCNEKACTFECQLDRGAWETCTSPKAYKGLTSGRHVFNVRARNQSGSIDPTPASYEWSITSNKRTQKKGGPR